MAAQLVFREKGDTSCPYHPGRKVEFQCEDCNGTLTCALCITSEKHKRHVFRELKDGLEEKVRNIEIFIENIEHEKIPEIDRNIKLIDDKIIENESAHDSLIKNATLYGERLKDEVDLQTGQYVSVLDKHKHESNDIYTEHRKKLIDFKQQLQKENEVIRKTCKSGTEIQVIDTESEISCKSIIIPQTPEINRPKFEPCTNIPSVIQQAFGVVSSTEASTKERSDVGSQSKIVPKKDEKDGSCFTKNTPNTPTTSVCQTNRTPSANRDSTTEGKNKQLYSCKLLDKPILVSQFDSPCKLWSVCPVLDNDMWILKNKINGSDEIYLVDHNGHIQKEVTCKQKLNDIVIHPNTGELHGCCNEDGCKTLFQIDTKNGSTRNVFNTEGDPWCVTITSAGNFVIGMYHKVCVYTPTGAILNSHDCRVTSHHISISNDDRQLALACRYSVLVLDDKFHEMYEYKGHDVKPAGEKREEFIARAAMFDSHTNLLVTDYENHEIHLLDGRTGEFLRTLSVKGMRMPRCLRLRYDGDLVVGCGTTKVLYIKYVQ